jgi:hypothetical protein
MDDQPTAGPPLRIHEDEHASLTELCIVCGAAAGQVDSCCSLACVERAQHELRANAKRLRRLPRHPQLLDARRELSERNGQLSSALMRWRPDPRRFLEAGWPDPVQKR